MRCPRLFAATATVLLAGCAATPPSAAPTTAPAPVATLAPGPGPAAGAASGAAPPADTGAQAPDAGGTPVGQNDPSAPPDTPLCGRAAREQIAAAAAIAPDVENGAGACVATACFDPLTDTFIGADGFRHVCQ